MRKINCVLITLYISINQVLITLYFGIKYSCCNRTCLLYLDHFCQTSTRTTAVEAAMTEPRLQLLPVMTSGEIWDVRLPRYWMRCRLYSYLQLTSAKCLSIVIKISRCDLFHFRAHNRQILLSMVTVFIEGKNCAINFVIIVKIPIVSRSKNRIWIIPSEFNGLASYLPNGIRWV